MTDKLAREARAIAALAFRNGPIEHLHAGRACPTCAGDVAYSRISDDEMRSIMRAAVDRLYVLLRLRDHDQASFESEIELGSEYAKEWDSPRNPPRSRP